MSAWNFSQTTASCHSYSFFHAAMPQQPISCGTSCHGMPVLSTNKITLKATRLSTGLRPGNWNRRGLGDGSSGSNKAHNSSLTNFDMICTSLDTLQIKIILFRNSKAHHSRKQGFHDALRSLILLSPVRCANCHFRFYQLLFLPG